MGAALGRFLSQQMGQTPVLLPVLFWAETMAQVKAFWALMVPGFLALGVPKIVFILQEREVKCLSLPKTSSMSELSSGPTQLLAYFRRKCICATESI